MDVEGPEEDDGAEPVAHKALCELSLIQIT
jgi:hypothetical protein